MKRCCFFASLQSAGRIIGWLGIIKAIIIIILGITMVTIFATKEKKLDGINEIAVVQSSVLIVAGCIAIGMSISLLLGIKKQKPGLILVWLIINGLGVMIYIYNFISTTASHPQYIKEYSIAYRTAICVLAVYCWIVILNLYAEIKENPRNGQIHQSDEAPKINHGRIIPNYFENIKSPSTVPYVLAKI